ncbi:MAG: CBS domain-containing protein, partial [Limisphaerales bacterium]
LLMRRSVLTEKLARRGHHITREYSIDLLEITRVRDVMDKNAPRVPATMKLWELADRIANVDGGLNRRQATLIVNEQDQLVGIITRGDIVRALRRNSSMDMTVAEAGSKDLTVAFPDELLHSALTKMLNRGVGRLPVVERDNPRKVVGYLGRGAILSARMKIHEEENIRQKSWGLQPTGKVLHK